MKTLFLTIAIVAALAAPVHAGDITPIVYECEQMNSARDGIRCGINGETLFIRIDSREDSPVELKKRTKYMVARMKQNFLAIGGSHIEMRVTTKYGKIMEQTCGRPKGRDWVLCDNPRAPDPKLARFWKHFD